MYVKLNTQNQILFNMDKNKNLKKSHSKRNNDYLKQNKNNKSSNLPNSSSKENSQNKTIINKLDVYFNKNINVIFFRDLFIWY